MTLNRVEVTMRVSEAVMAQMWPRATPRVRKAVAACSEQVFAKYQLTTPLRVVHFMAQISHECGGGTIIRENMNYSAERLMKVFGVGVHSARVTASEAQALANHPTQIAERVYGLGNPKKAKELENTRPGDGWRYRGNGMLQLTGRKSHRAVSEKIGFDLEANPEMLEDPATSFEVAAAEFKALNCIPAADADNVGLVTRRVNGGSNGLAERKVWLRRWRAVIDGIDETAQLPRGAETQRKSASKSTIIQGGTIATVATTAVAVKEAANAVADSAGSVSDAADKASPLVQPFAAAYHAVVARPTLVVAIIAVVACVFVVWQRYRKLDTEEA